MWFVIGVLCVHCTQRHTLLHTVIHTTTFTACYSSHCILICAQCTHFAHASKSPTIFQCNTHIYIYVFGGHKIFISFRLSCLIIYLLLRLHWFAMHEWNSYTNDTIAYTKYSMQIKSFVFSCVCFCVAIHFGLLFGSMLFHSVYFHRRRRSSIFITWNSIFVEFLHLTKKPKTKTPQKSFDLILLNTFRHTKILRFNRLQSEFVDSI